MNGIVINFINKEGKKETIEVPFSALDKTLEGATYAPVDTYEEDDLLTADSEVCKENDLFSFTAYPEFKLKRWKLYVRYTKYAINASICYPNDIIEEAGESLQKCFIEACAAGAAVIAIGALTPPALAAYVPAANIAFEQYFKNCLSNEFRDKVKIDVKFVESKTDWKRA